jgi:hypothetical protein
VWRPDKRGIHGVRSAHRFYLKEIVENAGLEVEGDWLLIWKLAIPPKVRNFIWQVAQNCLPTRVRLNEKGVQIGKNYPWCNDVPETATHTMIRCNQSRLTWVKLNLIHYIDQAQLHYDNIGGRIFYWLNLLSNKDKCIFAMNIWSLWMSRNVSI